MRGAWTPTPSLGWGERAPWSSTRPTRSSLTAPSRPGSTVINSAAVGVERKAGSERDPGAASSLLRVRLKRRELDGERRHRADGNRQHIVSN